MNILETIITIILLAMVVMTLFTEPKISVSYFKACAKSGVKAFNIIKGMITNEKTNKLQGNQEEQNTGGMGR